MNKYKPILMALAFILCLALGFGITKLVKPGETTPPQDEETVGGGGLTTQTDPGTDTTSNESSAPKDTLAGVPEASTVKQEATQVVISTTTPKLNGTTYSFSARCSGAPAGTKVRFILKSGSRTVATSSDGAFSGIPANASGSYTLAVMDVMTGKLLGSKVVSGFKDNSKQKMSKAQFQSLLLSGDPSILGGKNPHVAKGIHVSVVGMNPDENTPYDVQSIRDKIRMGIWKSAHVESIGYDDQGRVNSIVVRPVY